jgi:N-acetylmuramoyl-L-alanine amidase
MAGTKTPVVTGRKVALRVNRKSIAIRVESAFTRGGARHVSNQPVAGATVELIGSGLTTTTNRWGTAPPLVVSGVADGDFTLRVTPAAAELRPTTTKLVDLAPPTGVDRAYRTLDLKVTLRAEELTAAALADPSQTHGGVVRMTKGSLLIDLKADFMRSPAHHPRPIDPATKLPRPPDMILVHHTGGATIAPALGEFLGGDRSPHYLLDVDGHLVKMASEVESASHAGVSRWAGVTGVNGTSVGIETVHTGSGAYPTEQIASLLSLLDDLTTRFGIAKHHIVGHEDVGTGPDVFLIGRKAGDPGPGFNWELLEAQGLGLLLSTKPPADAVLYAGTYASSPTALLTAASPKAAIQELQNDLDAIGYSLKKTGVYDGYTSAAVHHFQLHFRKFTRAGTGLRGDRLDLETAREIKRCQKW